MNTALRALNRFGLGARIGESAALGDPRGWVRAQLRGPAPQLGAPAGGAASELGSALERFRTLRRLKDDGAREARRRLVEIGTAELRQTLTARVTSDRPFIERLVAFWSNHLCVSAAGKVLVAPLAGSYERDVIRPHVLGRFEDMVLASAKHPAMLLYLDNAQSVGPRSPGGGGARGRAGRARPGRGLNENYARELLELHTLGVNGGYAQSDVQELARMLTGWTVRPGGGTPRFEFRERLHEPGAKTLLGIRYAEEGVREGERAIRALCRHSATAQFVARKLVGHFVSDVPPPTAVARVARAFSTSDGDLRAVAEALVDAPEAWDDDARKFRAPQDWLVAVLRACGAPSVRENVGPILRQLRQPLWAPPAPKGYGDTAQEWADPDSLLNRAELARTIARLPLLREVDPPALLDVMDVPARGPLAAMLRDRSIAADERVALALAGPAFQWR